MMPARDQELPHVGNHRSLEVRSLMTIDELEAKVCCKVYRRTTSAFCSSPELSAHLAGSVPAT